MPHGSNPVSSALTDFSCQDTAKGKLGFDPVIPGMTEGYDNCEDYRQSIFDRSKSEDDYGPIWLDDSVGALLTALENKGVLENTIFLFQMDHGMQTKSALYEGGIRIPQFIHYPREYKNGIKLDVPVSTIDIAPTMFQFAGIDPGYELDGESWKNVIGNQELEAFWKDERCLFFEMQKDRATRCGCWKYLSIYAQRPPLSTTYKKGNRFGYSNELDNSFDLCGGTTEYVTEASSNQEVSISYPDPINEVRDFNMSDLCSSLVTISDFFCMYTPI